MAGTFGSIADTVSPGRTPWRAIAEARRRTRSCNWRYVIRSSPCTTARRSGWIAAVRARNKMGVSGAKFAAFGLRLPNRPPLRRAVAGGRFVAVFFDRAARAVFTGLRRDLPAAPALVRLVPLA